MVSGPARAGWLHPRVGEHASDAVVTSAAADYEPAPVGLPSGIHEEVAGLLVHFPVRCGVAPGMRIRRVACSIRTRTGAWVAVPASGSSLGPTDGRWSSVWISAGSLAGQSCRAWTWRPRGVGYVAVPAHDGSTVRSMLSSRRGSGSPLDQNLYPSVKGMSAASQVTTLGGVIICAAECRDGFPDHRSYLEVLRSAQTPQALLGHTR